MSSLVSLFSFWLMKNTCCNPVMQPTLMPALRIDSLLREVAMLRLFSWLVLPPAHFWVVTCEAICVPQLTQNC